MLLEWCQPQSCHPRVWSTVGLSEENPGAVKRTAAHLTGQDSKPGQRLVHQEGEFDGGASSYLNSADTCRS